jgi:hypothetical protein
MTATRALAVAPVLLTLTAAAGFAICKIARMNPHAKEMWIACGIGLIAGELGLAPALLRQGKNDVAALLMAALAGSVIHMGVVVVLAIVTMLLMKPSGTFAAMAFVGWIMAAYWPTLIGLCAVFRMMFQASAPSTGSGQAPSAQVPPAKTEK